MVDQQINYLLSLVKSKNDGNSLKDYQAEEFQGQDNVIVREVPQIKLRPMTLGNLDQNCQGTREQAG